MSSLKSIFRFYVDANIHVALSTWALTSVTGILFNIDVFETSICVGCATFLSYNLIRFQKIKSQSNREEVSSWFLRQKSLLLVLSIISLIVLVVIVVKVPIEAYIVVSPFFIITTFYIFPFWKIKKKSISLRTIPSFKIFGISTAWAGICVLFPVAVVKNGLDMRSIWLFFEQLLFLVALTIPFDIRDLGFDSNKLKTLPQLLGIKQVKVLGGILLVLSLCVHYYILFEFTNYSYLLVCILLWLFIVYSKQEQSKYYASFWVEGIPIIWYCLLCLY